MVFRARGAKPIEVPGSDRYGSCCARSDSVFEVRGLYGRISNAVCVIWRGLLDDTQGIMLRLISMMRERAICTKSKSTI